MGWGLGVFGTIQMLLWWVLIILGIMVLVKWLVAGSLSSEREGESRTLQILKERYAGGQIGKEEFEQKKQDLRK